MSRTRHSSKGWGYEYWSRRYTVHWNPGNTAKRFGNRVERRLAKLALRGGRIGHKGGQCLPVMMSKDAA